MKNPPRATSPSAFASLTNDKVRQIASFASVAIALILIAAKALGVLATGSVALLSSLVDSGIDFLASLITAYGIMVSLRPPDRRHRFGHGKAEALASLAQTVFILLSALFLFEKAIRRLHAPAPIERLDFGYDVMGLSVILTTTLLALQTYAIRRTGSLAIASDRLHYIGDFFVTLAVMGSFALEDLFSAPWVDPAFALVIALVLVVGAVKILGRIGPVLMDAELPENQRTTIIACARSVPGVLGVHDLRTRTVGQHSVIEAHVEMEPSLPLFQAHAIAEAVMAAIEKSFPDADILIHQDPAGVKERRLDEAIEKNEDLS